mmetsp:Transcript_15164/g.44006  ORF Transcript_15164/g.44006 Transcript_15164/m.44006 type:complete len:119 (-) Transcript_15164:314-670(-)
MNADEEFYEADAPMVNSKVHPLVSKAVEGMTEEFKDITITQLMAASDKPLQCNDEWMGNPGMCLTFNIAGHCTLSFKYRHAVARPWENRVKQMEKLLEEAVVVYWVKPICTRKRWSRY